MTAGVKNSTTKLAFEFVATSQLIQKKDPIIKA